MSLGRNEDRGEVDLYAHIVSAGYRIQNGYQLQLREGVIAGRGAMVLSAVQVRVNDGRSTHDVRVLAKEGIRVVSGEQSYQ